MPDPVHMLIPIPPKHSVSQVVGYLQGKRVIHLARTCGGKRRNFVGQRFWARGYWVSTVGRNEAAVRSHIQQQEKEDQRLDQLGCSGAKAALSGIKINPFERFTITSPGFAGGC